MLDNKYRCEEVLPMYRSEATATVEGLKFYLETLESFIDDEREKEISTLKRKIEHLSEDEQGEFWAWHYPVHWDDIFASQLRASFIVTLFSLAESHLSMVAEQASEIVSTRLKLPGLHERSFGVHRKFLESQVGFTRPSKDSWKSLNEIRQIRNCIVHANSTVYRTDNQKRLESLVTKLPGLSASYGIIEFASDFPQHCLAVVQNFLTELYDEASTMCQKLV